MAPDRSQQHQVGIGLVAQARAMRPALRARQAAVTATGQVPSETISEFEQAGLFRALQPQRNGGLEISPLHYLQIVKELAEGCMSSAWVYSVLACHNWQLALFDTRAADDVWREDSSIRASSSYMPVGKVVPVQGGFRLSGRWAFSSGSAHAQWVILGAVVPGDRPEPRNFLLPRSDYQIIQNWDVMGLRGTGSNDILVEDAFVPEYRTISEQHMFDMNCPGHASNQGVLYRIPFAQVFNRAVATPAIGALRAALDSFVDMTRQRRATYTGERLARDPSIQMAVSEVEATLAELDLVQERDCAELGQRASSGEWPMECRARLGVSTTTMVARCVAEIDKLMQFSGGKAIYRGNPIQQAFLDIHTARAHVANNPFPYGRNLGAIRFGLENTSQDI